ncbi:copper chaperone PCu(A)C [Streptomyces sp. 900105245]
MNGPLAGTIARLTGRGPLTDSPLAALVPVAAAGLALAGLTAWVGAGYAGSPARIRVTEGRVLLPTGASPETAAFFRITNGGGSTDRLLGVTSPAVHGGVTLARHRMGAGATAYRDSIDAVEIPAGRTVAMSPHSVDLTVPVPAGAWRAGDRLSFTLTFRRGGRVRIPAVVVRPGTAAFRP